MGEVNLNFQEREKILPASCRLKTSVEKLAEEIKKEKERWKQILTSIIGEYRTQLVIDSIWEKRIPPTPIFADPKVRDLRPDVFFKLWLGTPPDWESVAGRVQHKFGTVGPYTIGKPDREEVFELVRSWLNKKKTLLTRWQRNVENATGLRPEIMQGYMPQGDLRINWPLRLPELVPKERRGQARQDYLYLTTIIAHLYSDWFEQTRRPMMIKPDSLSEPEGIIFFGNKRQNWMRRIMAYLPPTELEKWLGLVITWGRKRNGIVVALKTISDIKRRNPEWNGENRRSGLYIHVPGSPKMEMIIRQSDHGGVGSEEIEKFWRQWSNSLRREFQIPHAPDSLYFPKN